MDKISVLGLGYVGTVLYGCLVRDGNQVIGVDIDPHKIKLLLSGSAPVIEEGIEDLCSRALQSGRGDVVSDVSEAVLNSDISFICVGTPSRDNGDQDLGAIMRVCEQIGKALQEKKSYHVVCVRSTVIPGTVQDVIAPLLERTSGKRIGTDIGLCFQPEFLREGSSIKDYDNPPFTVVGGDSEKSTAAVAKLFEHLPSEIITTDIKSAEMLKYCCNAFHALKITFANEVGRISRSLGVDSRKVMDLVCMDTSLNISRTYMRPGFAFGGSCLPKDLRGLVYAARARDVDVPMLDSLLRSNTRHIEGVAQTIFSLGRKTIGLVGLSFKSGTDDLRESPAVRIAERLIGKGWGLLVYDPQVKFSQLVGANKNFIEQTIPHIAALLNDDSELFFQEAEVVVVVHAYPEILNQIYSDSNANKIIYDLQGSIDKRKVTGQYIGICW